MGIISARVWDVYDWRPVRLFKMENSSGAYIELSNYGATLVSVYVPDEHGRLDNVVLGYPTLQGYLKDTAYMGATIGRFANRIAFATFELDGMNCRLEDNDNGNSNHGGSSGFHSKVFDFEITDDLLIFNLESPDGEGGYPGNLRLQVTYQWTEASELIIDYRASCDRKTIANFTNHAYFNLSSDQKKIFDHRLTVYADQLLEASVNYIPTGRILACDGLKFNQTLISDKIRIEGDRIEGLNVCYVLNDREKTIRPAAKLQDESSGRMMEVYTSYPGMMLYTGDFLNSVHPGQGGESYAAFDGLCLECQYFPDSPNQSGFPSIVLNAGEVYKHTIVFKFGIIAL
ncbi:MAG TPA: aldose epimerase family protein [Pedobacter sp.]|nr:aldose epimerase family protein [Pedobacter sp.]